MLRRTLLALPILLASCSIPSNISNDAIALAQAGCGFVADPAGIALLVAADPTATASTIAAAVCKAFEMYVASQTASPTPPAPGVFASQNPGKIVLKVNGFIVTGKAEKLQ